MADKFEEYCFELERVALRVMRRMGQEISVVLETGMSPAQFLVMRLIGDRGSMTMTAISAHMGVTLSAVTSLSDRLKSGGWVSRERNEMDRRIVCLTLTAAGQTKLKEMEQKRLALVRKYLGRLPAEDVEQLLRLLSRLAAEMDTMPND